MSDSKSSKKLNGQLRRNIWRSLLIMKSAALSELPAVVSNLSYRKARSLMRELETHGYVGKHTRHGRPEYYQAVDSPCLPAACKHCGRPFDSKACAPSTKKALKEGDRRTERQRETKSVATSATPDQTLPEVTHDAA